MKASRIAEGTRLKEEGNKYFKAGDLTLALKHYKLVQAFVNGVYAPGHAMYDYAHEDRLLSPKEALLVQELLASTFSNIALCYVKLEKPEKVLYWSNKAIVVDPNHVKSLIRIGSIQAEKQDFAAAKETLQRARKIDPKNSVCLTQLNFCLEKLKTEKETTN